MSIELTESLLARETPHVTAATAGRLDCLDETFTRALVSRVLKEDFVDSLKLPAYELVS